MTVEFQNHVSESLGRIEATLNGLAGPEGRITKIEKHVQWSDTKQWLHSSLIIPVTAGLNILIRHLTK